MDKVNNIDISVVIPVFNAEKSLRELNNQLVVTLKSLGTFELIYVDDKSQDSSWEILKEIQLSTQHNITIIRLTKNFGQHNATMCGLNKSSGALVVTIDDDLENPPQSIPDLIKKQEETGADLVYATPTNKSLSFLRRVAGWIYKKIAKITADGGKGSSFRLLTRSLVNQLSLHRSSFVFIDEFCCWNTDKISYLSVEFGKSLTHSSRYGIIRLSKMTWDLVMISATWPMKLVTFLGTALMIVNFIIGGYFIIRKVFFSIGVEGYASLIVSILFSTGLILFSLGLIAQFISKILLNNYNKPMYVISEENDSRAV